MTACEINVNKTSSILRAAVSEIARQDICQGELQTTDWKGTFPREGVMW